jgi:hypothetical protein
MSEMAMQRLARYGYFPFALFLCPLAGLVSFFIIQNLARRNPGYAEAVFCFVAVPALLAYLVGRATQRSKRDMVGAAIGAAVLGPLTLVALIYWAASQGAFT